MAGPALFASFHILFPSSRMAVLYYSSSSKCVPSPNALVVQRIDDTLPRYDAHCFRASAPQISDHGKRCISDDMLALADVPVSGTIGMPKRPRPFPRPTAKPTILQRTPLAYPVNGLAWPRKGAANDEKADRRFTLGRDAGQAHPLAVQDDLRHRVASRFHTIRLFPFLSLR